MGLVVGIDLGTQSCKAIVCDPALGVRGAHAIAYPTHRPASDRAEQDPGDWERALAPAIAGALAAAGAAPVDVVALAIAGQLDGCVAVDADDAPLHAALIWQDRRAPVVADPARVFAIAAQVADPTHLAPKLAWLRAHGVRATRWHAPTTFLVARLTGASVIDRALASTTMLYDLAAGDYSAELLAAFAVDRGALPAIREATDVAGVLDARGARLTGLAVGTCVAVGTGDDFANPLGVGLVAPGAVACSLGTAEVVGAIAATPVVDRLGPEPMVETHAYPAGGYFVENPGWLSGGAVRWASQLLGLSGDAELDALAAAAPPGAGGVTFLPALAGAMTPVWRPHATGTLHGLRANHGREHVARAVLEGLAFACREVVERLAALGLATDRVHAVGGGARSDVWMRVRADVLGRPHGVSAERDASALGAAMIALVAARLARDLHTAAALAPPPDRVVEPDPIHAEAYAGAYRRYRELGATLAAIQITRWVDR